MKLIGFTVGVKLFLLPLLFLCSVNGNAKTVTVSWDPNTESDLAGYKILIGEEPGQYTGIEDAGKQTNFTWNNLPSGTTYYFAVLAYDNSGNESSLSQEISATIGIQDNSPPEIIQIKVMAENQVDVLFSEAVTKVTAEDKNNYQINNGISVIGAFLDDNNSLIAHLFTSPHQPKVDYTMTISGVMDPGGNEIATGSSKTYKLPNQSDDQTPPQVYNVIVSEATVIEVVFNEPLNRQIAEQISNYSLDNQIQILSAVMTDNKSIIKLTTSAHRSESSYRLTMNNIEDVSGNVIVENSSFTYQVNLTGSDSTPPNVQAIIVNGVTQIDVKFNEPLDQGSAENRANYSIDSDIEIIGIILGDDLKTVHLITSRHSDEQNYNLVVNSIGDRAEPINQMQNPNRVEYIFEQDGRIDGGDNSIMPQTFTLFQNYPNPFNPDTEIRFYLEKERQVELKIFNTLGQLVKTLSEDRFSAGFHTLKWNGTTKNNQRAPSGVYVYSLEIRRQEQNGDLLVDTSVDRRVKRMTFLK